MDKTLKQVADELGVSKDKVKYRVGKLPSKYTVKKDGITYLKPEGFQIIEKIFKEKAPSNLPNNNQLILLLQQELDILHKQLQEKDSQLATAHKLLDQEQQLRMVTEQKLLAIEQSENEPPKKHWWSTAFKKQP